MNNINERIQELEAIANRKDFKVKDNYIMEKAVFDAEIALARKALAIIEEISGILHD